MASSEAFVLDEDELEPVRPVTKSVFDIQEPVKNTARGSSRSSRAQEPLGEPDQ